MDITISSKYQVVIPKAVRRQLNLKPGQKLHIEKVADQQLTLTVPLTTLDLVDRYYGSAPQGAWGSDPVQTIRSLRDEWKKMIAFDTNVLIYFIEGSPQFGAAAASILRQLASTQGCVSSLVFAEFAAGKQTAAPKTKSLETFIDGLIANDSLIVIDLNRSLASRAGQLRHSHPVLSTPDAIHLVSAHEAGANVFYTNDKQLIKLGAIDQLRPLTIKPLV